MARRVCFAGGTLVTLDASSTIRRADLLIEDGRIAAIGGPFPDAEPIDCAGALVLPGFVQAHVHLCQALFRGLAEETDLLLWLERKIWPLEAAHTSESLVASARFGLLEAVRAGTTTVCDMGAVRHADVLAEAVRESGVRAVVSKLLMDQGSGVPGELIEEAKPAIEQARRLFERFDGAEGGRLRVALAPRFVLSCSRDLLASAARASQDWGALVHTHLNESRREVETSDRALGRSTVSYFDEIGLLSERLVAAHGVWFADGERERLGERGARIVHCPSANLKLGSGICDVRALRDAGVTVALGADGLPGNNRSDPFAEMRLAGLLSRGLRGERALTAEEVVRLATLEGARALGLDRLIGSLEVGKRGDVVVIDASGAEGELLEGTDPYGALVYQMSARSLRAVAVDGRLLWEGGRARFANEDQVLADARRERTALMGRAGLPADSRVMK